MDIKSLDQKTFSFLKEKSNINSAILPLGSIEQHGDHLPFATDTLIVEHISKIVSNKTNSLLLPAIYYGTSFEHDPLFNISIKYNNMVEVLSDVCFSLYKQNMKRIFIINGHHGNLGLLQYIGQNIASKYSLNSNFVYIINYWQILDKRFDHAGEVETSLMIAINPNLVKREYAKTGMELTTDTAHERISKVGLNMSINNPGGFVRATKNGIWGDPTQSSAEEGEKMLSQVIETIITLILDKKYQ